MNRLPTPSEVKADRESEKDRIYQELMDRAMTTITEAVSAAVSRQPLGPNGGSVRIDDVGLKNLLTPESRRLKPAVQRPEDARLSYKDALWLLQQYCAQSGWHATVSRTSQSFHSMASKSTGSTEQLHLNFCTLESHEAREAANLAEQEALDADPERAERVAKQADAFRRAYQRHLVNSSRTH